MVSPEPRICTVAPLETTVPAELLPPRALLFCTCRVPEVTNVWPV